MRDVTLIFSNELIFWVIWGHQNHISCLFNTKYHLILPNSLLPLHPTPVRNNSRPSVPQRHSAVILNTQKNSDLATLLLLSTPKTLSYRSFTSFLGLCGLKDKKGITESRRESSLLLNDTQKTSEQEKENNLTQILFLLLIVSRLIKWDKRLFNIRVCVLYVSSCESRCDVLKDVCVCMGVAVFYIPTRDRTFHRILSLFKENLRD